MKHQFLIFIDSLFKPFYTVINALKRKGESSPENQHFLVLKFFGLGSITRIVHVMDAIALPKERVTFVTLYKNKSVIDLLDLQALYVNTKHPLIFIRSVFQLIVHIWKLKNTTILDMERASNISGLFRLMIGFKKPCHSFHFKSENQNRPGQFFVSLKNKPATQAIAEMFHHTYIEPLARENKPISSNKVFVNINAGNYISERKFTPSKYADLIKTLHDKNPHWEFYLTGAKAEYHYVEAFKNRLTSLGIPAPQVYNIAGQHNLSGFITFLEEAKLFITNDSGPLHLAHFFGIKTVGIWGPTSSRLVGYKDSNHMLNFNPEIDCAPCFTHPKSQIAKSCQGEITCFKLRNTGEMASKIISFAKLEKEIVA
ncbi:glycosyltransferase family 9 protein [Spongiimicrobium salis]|uniref:glycosyltransferase family 9 protein n=1 Tax=Spongiimicrobium salis TaxID=1667022 RepID=UPI00374D4593